MYSKEISGKMLPGSIIKSLAAIIVFLVAYRYVGSCGVVLIVTQTVLSVYILQDTIMLMFYKARMDSLFDYGYKVLIINKTVDNNIAEYLAYAVEYEAIKAHYKIRLNEKLFNKIKEDLEFRWKQMLRFD